jgi:ABC-type lipoprotein release transport system permease subunit
MKGKVSGIRLKVDDLFNAKKITNEVINSLNSSQYYGVDWTQQKANFTCIKNTTHGKTLKSGLYTHNISGQLWHE